MMGCVRINWMFMMIVIVWSLMCPLVKMEDEVVSRAKIYSCWGGCYNDCFLLQKSSDNNSTKTYQCYYNCLNNCTSSTPTSSTSTSTSDYEGFCKGACFLMICLPLSFGGANVGDCTGNCGKLCNFFSTFTNMKLKE